jgi:hypothetical protein
MGASNLAIVAAGYRLRGRRLRGRRSQLAPLQAYSIYERHNIWYPEAWSHSKLQKATQVTFYNSFHCFFGILFIVAQLLRVAGYNHSRMSTLDEQVPAYWVTSRFNGKRLPNWPSHGSFSTVAPARPHFRTQQLTRIAHQQCIEFVPWVAS